ncbi:MULTISPECIES: copper resistance D family protein [Gordonia]|jgi:copper transport protein|uniref:copper resistance D family protein n=1 Tax=Gordonia TaxID=2053 RepID=UPI0030C7A069
MDSLTSLAAAAPASKPAWQIMTTIGYFTALSFATGLCLALAYLLPSRARDGRTEAALASLARPVAVLALLGGFFQYVARVTKSDLDVSWSQAASFTHATDYLTLPKDDGTWMSGGVMGTVQFVLFIALAAILWNLAATPTPRLASAGFVTSILAAAMPSITLASTSLDKIANRELKLAHILAADIWVGGLVVLAAAGVVAARRRGGGEGSTDEAGAWEQMWSRFSTWAMGAVIAITVSGVWLTWVHLGSFSQFVTTSYGRFLLIKLILVAFMIGAGTYNALVLIPKIRRARVAGDERTFAQLALGEFPRVVIAEALAAFAILVIVPFLSGSARKMDGQADAGPFDWGTFGLGFALIALAVAGCTATIRGLERRDASLADEEEVEVLVTHE